MKLANVMIILIILLAAVPGEACAKSVKAYYNGREATVTGVVLHPGEPFTVDLYITPDAEAYAYAEIDEPGVTRAYDRIEGDPVRPTVTRRCNASHPAHYRWVMSANGNWLDGIAPLNVYYQWSPVGETGLSGSGLFTVVDAYIAPGEVVVNVSAMPAAKTPAPGLWATALGIIVAISVAKARPGARSPPGARARRWEPR